MAKGRPRGFARGFARGLRWGRGAGSDVGTPGPVLALFGVGSCLTGRSSGRRRRDSGSDAAIDLARALAFGGGGAGAGRSGDGFLFFVTKIIPP